MVFRQLPRRSLLARGAIISIGLGAQIVLGGASAFATSPGERPTMLADSLFELTNEERVRHGLPVLAFDPALAAIADARAEAQAGPALSHLDSSGQLAFVAMMEAAGVHYRLAGENLARAPAEGVAAARMAADGFMNSPAHRRNILEVSFDRLAIGVARDAAGRIVFAQVFRASSA